MPMITSKNRWWIRGLFSGAFMFLFMGVLLPLAEEEQLTTSGLLIRLFYWTAAGLVGSWIISFIDGRQKVSKKQSSDTV